MARAWRGNSLALVVFRARILGTGALLTLLCQSLPAGAQAAASSTDAVGTDATSTATSVVSSESETDATASADTAGAEATGPEQAEPSETEASDVESEADSAAGNSEETTSAEGQDAAEAEEEPTAAEVIDSWSASKDAEKAEQSRRRKELPLTRWSEVGGFFGMVYRGSGSDKLRYKVGRAYGGYFRPQIFSFLGVRLYYREERIPVNVHAGGYDYQDETHDLDFKQSDLKVTSLGVRVEPSWNPHPQVQLIGVLGWGWVRSVAELPTAPGFDVRAKRAAVELNWQLGAGVGVDLIRNWLNLSVIGTYSFISNQTGNAYGPDPAQVIIDGQMTHLSTLPHFSNPVEALVSLGLVL